MKNNNSNEKTIKSTISNINSNIKLNITILNNYQNTLLDYISSTVDSSESCDIAEDSDNLINSFTTIKQSLTLLTDAINKCKEFSNSLKEALPSNDEDELSKIVSKYFKIQKEVSNLDIDMQKIINDVFISKAATSPEIKEEINQSNEENKNTTKKSSKKTKNSSFKESTLIISEINNVVTLPYTLQELKENYNVNIKSKKAVEAAIKEYFTLPIEKYKNASLARFKEAYKLVKKKENGSVQEALDLGLELFFNNNLNPAIITACKNLDELDIYLSCLEDNKLSEFKCFNIIYEALPAIVKSKKKNMEF